MGGGLVGGWGRNTDKDLGGVVWCGGSDSDKELGGWLGGGGGGKETDPLLAGYSTLSTLRGTLSSSQCKCAPGGP